VRRVVFAQLSKKKFARHPKREGSARVCPGSMRYCDIVQAVATAGGKSKEDRRLRDAAAWRLRRVKMSRCPCSGIQSYFTVM
jgi:hypothetical protein